MITLALAVYMSCRVLTPSNTSDWVTRYEAMERNGEDWRFIPNDEDKKELLLWMEETL